VGDVLNRTTITGLSILSVLITAIALAQSSNGDFEITKSTIDNGGGTSSNGEFSITGTIGQPDANRQISTGGGFLLAGGFWAKAHNVIFENSFEGN
jgi:adhesin HecA-like repeat protein